MTKNDKTSFFSDSTIVAHMTDFPRSALWCANLGVSLIAQKASLRHIGGEVKVKHVNRYQRLGKLETKSEFSTFMNCSRIARRQVDEEELRAAIKRSP